MIVSYGVKITNDYSVFKDTIRIFRAAVKYIIPIALKHYGELEQVKSVEKQRLIEKLIHGTSTFKATYNFDKKFYKFPSYFRRSAISIAIGIVEKYVKELNRWTGNGKTYKKPHLNFNNAIMPIFFRNNTFKQKEMRKKVRNHYSL